MPTATPTLIDKQTAASGTTLTLTAAAPVAAGTMVFVNAGHDSAGTVTITVTDSRSNTYTKDAYTADGNTASSGLHAGVYRSILTTALQSGDTITVTYSSNSSTIAAAGYSVTSVAASPKDVARQDHAAGSESTVNPGSITTTNPDDLLIVALFHDTTATTSGANGYTLLDEIAPVSTRKLSTLYKQISSPGAVDQNAASLSGASADRAVIVAYKAAALSPNLLLLGVG